MINIIIFSCLSISFHSFVDTSSAFSISSSSTSSNISSLSRLFNKLSVGIKSTLSNYNEIPSSMNHLFDDWKERGIIDPAHEMDRVIMNIGFTFPIPVIDLIVEYNPIESSRNEIDKIAVKLGISEKSLNLYNDDFLKRLALIVKEKRNKFSPSNLFWWDLEKLFFKHILYLKTKLANASLIKLIDVSRDIESSISTTRRINHPDFSSYFDLAFMNITHFNSDLLDSEYFENSDKLFDSFAKALEYFYLSSNSIIGNGNKKLFCENFKMIFFENGNLDTNTLLKFFMIQYDR